LKRLHQVHDASFAPQGLGVVRDFFSRLHAADLVYCHWKSNEHLSAAVDGLTDLDVLVDPRRNSDLQRILAESGFKRFAAPPLRAYPAIEDYLALDPLSGRLVHLHLHYQLTLGERHLKSYRLPWEGRLLAERRLDPRHGVYVADPALELLLLLVRIALKRRLRDSFLVRIRRLGQGAKEDFNREFAWLRQRVSEPTLRMAARHLLGVAVDEPLSDLLAKPRSRASIASFGDAIEPVLRRYRTFRRGEAQVRAWVRELQWIADVVNRRYLHRAIPLRRISPRGGTVIVLLGADGAGKSTLVKTLVTWLGVKLDVLPIYFGSGDGPSAVYRLPMKIAYRFLIPFLGPRPEPPNPGNPEQRAPSSWELARSRLRAAARVPWAIALSCEKRGKLRRLIRARNLGMIVVCDRYPQSQFSGFSDGPLLAHWRDHPFFLCRALAAWEARPYVEAALNPPDVVLKLSVTPEVAQARRPEMNLAELRRRVRAVQDLHFPPCAHVLDLNADAPFHIVTLQAKEAVWTQL
jgi:hypothetical protein